MNSEKPTIRPDPEILRKTAIFRSLDESDFRTLLVCLRGRTCPAGEILFSEGDPGQSMMIVAEGTFVALVRRKDGVEQEINRMGVCETIGEMAFLDLALTVGALVLLVPIGYLGFLTLLSAKLPPPPPGGNALRFDIVVPATTKSWASGAR